MNDILLRIKEIMAEKNLSGAAFSNSIGITQSTFSNFFQRDSVPRADIIGKISNEYGVNSNWLLTGEGPMFLEQGESSSQQNNIEDQGEVISNSAKSVPSAHEVLTSWIQSLDDEEAANVLKYLLDLPLKKRK